MTTGHTEEESWNTKQGIQNFLPGIHTTLIVRYLFEIAAITSVMG